MACSRNSTPATREHLVDQLHRRLRALTFVAFVAFSSPAIAGVPDDSAGYRLAPGDRITVTIFGQPELSGDLMIDGAGNITVPFIEPLRVKDLTVSECQTLIRDRLADGILRNPAVAVRINELRPLYVLGDVRLPGTYPFRYGSTVQSAVALAGGFGPIELVHSAAVSDFLLADERVRQLTMQKQTLLVRRARLEAQRDGLNSFSPPPLPALIKENDLARVIADEKDTFDTQAAILKSQIDLLRSQRPRLEKEIEAHNEQIAASRKQLQLIRQEIDRVDRLVKQGLATQPVNFQLKISEANQEMNLWALTAQVSQLQIDLGNLDLRTDDAEAAFKRQAAADLRDARDHLNDLDTILPVARELRDIRLQYAGGLVKVGVKRTISIMRVRNGEAPIVLEATETTPLEPGDIIEVKRLLPGAVPQEGASLGQHNMIPDQPGPVGTARIVGSVSPVPASAQQP